MSQLQTTRSNVWPSARSSSPLARARLDDANFHEVAEQAYVNIGASEEMEDDLRLIRYIKRQFNAYRETGDLKPGLIFNHIRVFMNVFKPTDVAVKMLIYRNMQYLDLLKPFLVALHVWPERIENIGIGGETIYGSDIPMDDGIVGILRHYRRHQ